jgi:murein DD-endopeptidase MepM/ murein hydrolase activator NlpD
MKYVIFGEEYRPKISFLFKGKFKPKNWVKINLSPSNPNLPRKASENREVLDQYIADEIKKSGARGAYGGYGEKRDLYKRFLHFGETDERRNIHLGVDFWLPAEEPVRAPLPGFVHSFADNAHPGDYGPTIILQHNLGNNTFFSLYGHLSKSSLDGLYEGKIIHRKEIIGYLGHPEENVDWPPHLHFQLIKDMGKFRGDYPGVCAEHEVNSFMKNTIDPMDLFAI